MSVYDAILASAVEGLKRKPVLIVHFLVTVFLGVIGVWVSKFFLEHILRCSLYFLNLGLVLIVVLTSMLISLGVYAGFWHSLKDYLRDYLPRSLDDALKDYQKFIQLIMDKTIYDFLDKDELKEITPNITILISSYYLTWIFGLYSIDLLLYQHQLSGHHYTIFGYLSENIYLTISLVLVYIP